MPARPRRRPKISRLSRRWDIAAASHAGIRTPGDGAIEQFHRAGTAEGLQIFLRLEHDAQRFLDRLRIERGPVERDERVDPVDGLGNPGLLVEVLAAQLL